MKYLATLLAFSAVMAPTIAHAEPITLTILSVVGITLEAGSAAAAIATVALSVPIGGAIAFVRRRIK